MPVLLASTAISASAAATAVTNLGSCNTLHCTLNCSAVPSGGAPTLDVYLQTSSDTGTTWRDIAHTQFTTSALKRFIAIAGQVTAGTAIIAASDAALSGETIVQGPWGDRLRIKYAFAAGGSTGTYTLSATCVCKP